MKICSTSRKNCVSSWNSNQISTVHDIIMLFYFWRFVSAKIWWFTIVCFLMPPGSSISRFKIHTHIVHVSFFKLQTHIAHVSKSEFLPFAFQNPKLEQLTFQTKNSYRTRFKIRIHLAHVSTSKLIPLTTNIWKSKLFFIAHISKPKTHIAHVSKSKTHLAHVSKYTTHTVHVSRIQCITLVITTMMGSPMLLVSTSSANGNSESCPKSMLGTFAPLSLCDELSSGSTYSCQKRHSAKKLVRYK